MAACEEMKSLDAIQSPISILCEWAWAKVNLLNLQRDSGDSEKIHAAILAYGRASRAKRKLDAEYRELHESLWAEEDPQLELKIT